MNASPLTRLPDWEARLDAYLRQAYVDVREGRQDYCALFVSGAAEAMTGVDLTASYRGRFHQAAENLEATIDDLLPPRPRALARRGDVAWHEGSVGLVIGGEALFVSEDQTGLPDMLRVPRSAWLKAWAV